MNMLKYVWRNITRNKIRSLLTILSVGFSLALMTVLYGFRASQDTWKNDASQGNRVVIMNVQGLFGQSADCHAGRRSRNRRCRLGCSLCLVWRNAPGRNHAVRSVCH